MNKTFNCVFQFNEHAKSCDPRNGSGIDIAYIAFHILCFFHIVHISFRFLSTTFTNAGICSCLCTPFRILFDLFFVVIVSEDIASQHSMHDKIGIAANRRGKVQIFLQTETEMSQTLCIIACLLHAAQHISGKNIVIVFSFCLFQQFLILRGMHIRSIDNKRISQSFGDAGKCTHFFRFRLFMYTVYTGKIHPFQM